jgi:hypothetical protein
MFFTVNKPLVPEWPCIIEVSYIYSSYKHHHQHKSASRSSSESASESSPKSASALACWYPTTHFGPLTYKILRIIYLRQQHIAIYRTKLACLRGLGSHSHSDLDAVHSLAGGVVAARVLSHHAVCACAGSPYHQPFHFAPLVRYYKDPPPPMLPADER